MALRGHGGGRGVIWAKPGAVEFDRSLSASAICRDAGGVVPAAPRRGLPESLRALASGIAARPPAFDARRERRRPVLRDRPRPGLSATVRRSQPKSLRCTRNYYGQRRRVDSGPPRAWPLVARPVTAGGPRRRRRPRVSSERTAPPPEPLGVDGARACSSTTGPGRANDDLLRPWARPTDRSFGPTSSAAVDRLGPCSAGRNGFCNRHAKSTAPRAAPRCSPTGATTAHPPRDQGPFPWRPVIRRDTRFDHQQAKCLVRPGDSPRPRFSPQLHVRSAPSSRVVRGGG